MHNPLDPRTPQGVREPLPGAALDDYEVTDELHAVER